MQKAVENHRFMMNNHSLFSILRYINEYFVSFCIYLFLYCTDFAFSCCSLFVLFFIRRIINAFSEDINLSTLAAYRNYPFAFL